MNGEVVAAAHKRVYTDRRPVTAETTHMTEYTPQYINQALAAVPANYWSLHCWSWSYIAAT